MALAAAPRRTHDGRMRRFLVVLTVAALSASLLVVGPAAFAAPSSDAPVSAAYNKKKCKRAHTRAQKRKYCRRSGGQGQQQGKTIAQPEVTAAYNRKKCKRARTRAQKRKYCHRSQGQGQGQG
jgi:hypothetical protein